jgi:predicted dehydrogenase
MDRRRFLQATAAGLATPFLPGAYAQRAPRKVGLIGSGWYGKIDLFRLIQVEDVDVVALCDVDKRMLQHAAEMTASRQASGAVPRTYADYQEMLRQEEMDLVLIATPDHWHALPMIDACKAGLDIYCQKPISVDVTEGQAMLAAARKYDRVVQIGTQRRSTPHLIQAKERIVDEGLLGDIGHIEICCYYHMRATGNPPDSKAPANLDYDAWTGPAPMRPYNSLVHPRSWRAFNEYGNGIVGDMCVHMLDMVRWMLGISWPTKISSSGGIFVQTDSKANITDTQVATFTYPNFPIVWTHRSYGTAPDPDYPWAAFIYGSKGTLKASVNRYDFVSTDGGETMHADVTYEREQYPEDVTEKDIELHVAPAVRGHMKDLLQAIDNRTRPVADIEEGYISTTSCILANIAMDLGRTLEWDPEAGQVVNDARANELLTRPYRSPYTHPYAGRA